LAHAVGKTTKLTQDIPKNQMLIVNKVLQAFSFNYCINVNALCVMKP